MRDELQFTKNHYFESFKSTSISTASRDLKQATDDGFLAKTGEMSLILYHFR